MEIFTLVSIESFALLTLLALVVFLIPKQIKGWYSFGVTLLSTITFGSEAVYRLLGVMGGSDNKQFDGLFAMDGLSAFFVIVISFVAISVGLYATGAIKDEHVAKRVSTHISLHLFSLNMLYLSMVGVLCSNNGVAFLTSWELMTIMSYLLILRNGYAREVRVSALNYLVLMHVCFVMLVGGFALLGDDMSFSAMGSYFDNGGSIALFILMLLGFGMKAGLVPLHMWLPDSYSAAPGYVSAVMSGAMSKMGVYGVIRVLTYMHDDLFTVGLIVFGMGVITTFWGVIYSTMQSEMKRLLAYSSVENLGIIFVAIGLSVIGVAKGDTLLTVCSMSGAMFHVLSHSMLKSCLFMSSESIYTVCGTTNMEQLGGVAKQMPMTAIFTLIGLLAICALPPLCGFASEFTIYYGLFGTLGDDVGLTVILICAIIILALAGGVAVISFTKLYGVMFSGESRNHDHKEIKEVCSIRTASFAIPIFIIISAGVLPVFVMRVVMPVVIEQFNLGVDIYMMLQMEHIMWGVTKVTLILIAITSALILLRRYLLKGRVQMEGPTWKCGFTAPTERMQYTGESYSDSLHSMVGSMSQSRIEGEVVREGEIFPSNHKFGVKYRDSISAFFSKWWVSALHNINKRVMFMRTSMANYYVLYALIFFFFILILSLLKVI